MSGKIRRIDYYPDEFISGVGGVLRADEQGVYWMVCSLIMSEGGPVPFEARRLAGLCLMRPSGIKRIIASLVERGKLALINGKLSQKRAQSEIERAANRIQNASENGAKGGRPRSKTEPNLTQSVGELDPNSTGSGEELDPKSRQTDGKGQQNQQKAKAGGFSGEKLTNNYQPATEEEAPHRPPGGGRTPTDFFDEFWKLYPKRQGANPKLPASEKFLRFVKQGEAAEDIVSGVKAYAAECGKNGDIGTKFVAQAVTWIGQRRWKDYLGMAGDDLGSFVRIRSGTPQWDAWLAHMEGKGEKTRFMRSRGEWPVPTEWPPKEEAA